jgi:hypothetical protein
VLKPVGGNPVGDNPVGGNPVGGKMDSRPDMTRRVRADETVATSPGFPPELTQVTPFQARTLPAQRQRFDRANSSTSSPRPLITAFAM